MSNDTLTYSTFKTGTCFGFDLGTASTGWSVRKGNEFADVGVQICPDEISNLENRRAFRSARRTNRNRKVRRKTLGDRLAKLLGINLHPGTDLPENGWEAFGQDQWKPISGWQQLQEPIRLRLRALEGATLQPEEIYTALMHLTKRRGYLSKVPWASSFREELEDKEAQKEAGEMMKRMQAIRDKMEQQSLQHPCQLLVTLANKGESQRGKDMVWPRELLENEFREILEAQKPAYPQLSDHVETLLHGNCEEVNGQSVFFKNSSDTDPGVMSLRWPRFDNRSPSLDSLQPVDSQGRPLHVVRKNKEIFARAQWEMALINFRVTDLRTGRNVVPHAESLKRLREIWESRLAKEKTKGKEAPKIVKISKNDLKKWVKEFTDYELIEGQQALTPTTDGGRSRYSSPTLEKIQKIISGGGSFDPPQPILQRKGENTKQALDRYLAEIPHPLVRHRLQLFRKILDEMLDKHGTPDLIVVEAARSLALGEKKKKELQKRNNENQKAREEARNAMDKLGAGTGKGAIQRYRLWKEYKTICPYCLEPITQEELLNGTEIEHIVPQTHVVSNEWENLTIAHRHCNKEKDGRTPFQAYGHTPRWASIAKEAKKHLRGRKLEIFLSDKAEELVESKANLQQSAYIAKALRKLVLIRLGWLDAEGRDPTTESHNHALRFQVTNGQITSRLRHAWGLNQLLNPLPPGKSWENLSEEEREQQQQKNRGDHRHHAIDAMVIACTLPWYATHTVTSKNLEGEDGWWEVDAATRKTLARNPIFPNQKQMRTKVEDWLKQMEIRHHASRSRNSQSYDTTLLGKKAPNTYVARKKLESITCKKLSKANNDVWPKELGTYLHTAWEQFKIEAPKDVPAKETYGLPVAIIQRLCFAKFQQWRAKLEQEQEPAFEWAKAVKLPIRTVSMIVVKDDQAVYDPRKDGKSYVNRQSFREVRVYPSVDGEKFIPVFFPSWKQDKPVYDGHPDWNKKPVEVIRKGQVVHTIKPMGGKDGYPKGKYLVNSTKRNQLNLTPHHLMAKGKGEVLESHGYPKSGIQPYWNDFLKALGHELPYRPSAEP